MKKQLSFFKFLILAVLSMIIAFVLEQQAVSPNSQLPDTQHFKKVLFEKEQQIDTVISNFHKQIKLLTTSQKHNLFETFADFNFKKNKENGFVVLVYLNDSIKFWSDNSLEIPALLSKSKLQNIVLQSNNAWYYVRNLHDNNIDIIGLIKIQDDFSYKNKYLENGFHKDFKLPSSLKISSVKISYSYDDIYDKENTYLFSLVPVNTISEGEGLDYIELLYFLGIVFIFIFLNKWIKNIAIHQRNPATKILLVFAFLLFLRYLMIEFKYPMHLYSSHFFATDNLLVSPYYPSLGDFFINSLIILVFANSLFYLFRPGKLIRFFKKKSRPIKYIFSFSLLAIVVLFFSYIINLFESLVINSNIPFAANKVMNLNLYSLMAYNTIAILLAAILVNIDRTIFILRHILKTKWLIITIVVISLLYVTSTLFFNINISSSSLIYLISSVAVILYVYIKRQKYHYSLYTILTIIASVYITVFINTTIKQKDDNTAKTLIDKVLYTRDRVAEHFLVSVESKIRNDDNLKSKIISNNSVNLDDIHKLLKQKYFKDYFDKYELDFVICGNSKNYVYDNKIPNCTAYYSEIINKYGKRLGKSNFYYIDNQKDNVKYQGFIDFLDTEKHVFTLYIILETKLISHDIGYPDLLIEGKAEKQNILKDYSYAKYQNGRLLLHSGTFTYDLNDRMFRNSNQQEFTQISENYKHYVKKIDNSLIVLTQARVKTLDLVIAFSYIFLFLNAMLLFALSITNFASFWSKTQLNFENKLLLSMLLVMILSFAMVTTGTVYYNTSQFKQKHNVNIGEKLESILKNLEMEDDSLFNIEGNYSVKKSKDIQNVLKTLSKIYYTDINLYNNEGRLIASSRPEIFEKGLIGGLMNPEAYKQITINEKIRFIHNENIGELEYASAYELLENKGINNALYINLPYFTKPSELRNELTNLVVAIVNLYVVLFVIVAFIAFFMANKITQPLRMLQSKLQYLEIGKQSEQIVYDKNDEVGALVNEYNKMVLKLEESVRLLAKTERESAWREMAKQIAHEIKNPLTPMKLSVQFLQRAWQNKDEDFNKKLEKSSKTLIDQITTLSNIATEFSNFAKMPKPKKEVVDIVVRVEHTIELFTNTENVEIESNVSEFSTLPIIADHEHISRVLTNLVKNGIQAIPGEQKGLIKIILEVKDNKVLIKISDNGIGIAEEQKNKLFTPNFTTKSSGMGMGLPIVKDIVESANGKIWFETELNIGTTFFVEFPLNEKPYKAKGNKI